MGVKTKHQEKHQSEWFNDWVQEGKIIQERNANAWVQISEMQVKMQMIEKRLDAIDDDMRQIANVVTDLQNKRAYHRWMKERERLTMSVVQCGSSSTI